MTYTDTAPALQARPAADDARSLPAPVPFDTPVLIGDCVSPLHGSTVLHLLWQRLADGANDA